MSFNYNSTETTFLKEIKTEHGIKSLNQMTPVGVSVHFTRTSQIFAVQNTESV